MPLTRSLLLAVLSGCLAACVLTGPKFMKPTVSVVSVELIRASLLQQSFLVKFNIQNPNDRELPVSGVHAELSVMGERIASGVSNRGFLVPALGSADFEMTITANMGLALLKLARSQDERANSIDYDMTGAASLDLPFLRAVPFHESGSIALR